MSSFKVWAVLSLVAVAHCASASTAVNAACVPMCLAPAAQSIDVAGSPQPFLDDPGKLTFRDRPKLDRFSLSGRAVPLTNMDPQSEAVTVSLTNIVGTFYEETIPAGEFKPNAKLTSWKYTRRKSGSSLIYSFKINKRYNRLTGNTEYLLKTGIEAALDFAVPVLSNRQNFLVTLRLPAQTSHPGALQFSVDYRGANGDFAGSRSETLECASVVGGAVAAFNDNDIGSLEVALASLNGVTAPSNLAQCIFASNGGVPVPSDFVISVTDAVNDIAQKDGSNVCGAPVTGSTPPHARDAYYVLSASVGNVTCDLCECDVSSNGILNSSDALRVLLAAVGATAPLHCPSSPACSDQPTIMSAGNAVGAIVDVASIVPLPYESHSEDELKTMSAQISIGDDDFYNSSAWTRTSYGWYLADKYMW